SRAGSWRTRRTRKLVGSEKRSVIRCPRARGHQPRSRRLSRRPVGGSARPATPRDRSAGRRASRTGDVDCPTTRWEARIARSVASARRRGERESRLHPIGASPRLSTAGDAGPGVRPIPFLRRALGPRWPYRMGVDPHDSALGVSGPANLAPAAERVIPPGGAARRRLRGHLLLVLLAGIGVSPAYMPLPRGRW